MQHTNQVQFDVIIAGGGATGASLALSLAQSGQLKVAVVEGAAHLHPEFKSQRPHDDTRSIALSAFSCELLAKLGLTNLADLSCPIEHIHVSDQGHLGQCTLHAKDYSLDALGRVIGLDLLGAELARQCTAVADGAISWFCPDKIDVVERSEQNVTLTLESGTKLSGALLVIAEGGQSVTRSQVGIETKVQDYKQVGLVANVELQDSHKNWAYERFTPQGPLALLPVLQNPSGKQMQNLCSLVWTCSPEDSNALISLDEQAFLHALQQAFGYRLGLFKSVSDRQSFPLSLVSAHQLISHRVVVLGNAAQSLHPIAGQGFNLALRDVATLSQCLLDVPKQDRASYRNLYRYQSYRHTDRSTLITATDSLVRIFSNSFFPLVIARNLGLTLLNTNSVAKTAFAKQAMGFNGLMGIQNAEL